MDVIEKAKRRREALLTEIRQLDDFIKTAEKLEADYQRQPASRLGFRLRIDS